MQEFKEWAIDGITILGMIMVVAGICLFALFYIYPKLVEVSAITGFEIEEAISGERE